MSSDTCEPGDQDEGQKGQLRKVAVKPTKEEHEERIEYAQRMLARHFQKHAIKKLLKARFNVNARTCEKYLARARERMLERSGRPKEVHRAEALALYESVIQDPESTRGERLAAQGMIDKLLALASPAESRVEFTDATPGRYTDEQIERRMERFAAVYARLAAGHDQVPDDHSVGNGEQVHPGPS